MVLFQSFISSDYPVLQCLWKILSSNIKLIELSGTLCMRENFSKFTINHTKQQNKL